MYNGVQYRSRLEARWAAFFDLIHWEHEYEPIDLPGWSPDFRVVFLCGHSECRGSHSLLVEVKPYWRIEQFSGHPCMDYAYGFRNGGHFDSVDILAHEGKTAYRIPADASAAFGANPEVTEWEMSHGNSGGMDCLLNWIQPGYSRLWKQAGNTVQWNPPSFSFLSLAEKKQEDDTEIKKYRSDREQIFNQVSEKYKKDGKTLTQDMIDRFHHETEREIDSIKRKRGL